MSPPSWSTEQKLDAEKVRHIVRSQFPTLAVKTVEFLGEGCDFAAYVIDRQWVFRFPKRREYATKLQVEVSLLRELAPLLPLPVPEYRFYGSASSSFPYAFAGYPMLLGIPAMHLTLSPTALVRTAQVLGKFLRCLHSYDVTQVVALGVLQASEDDTFAAVRDRALERLASVRSILTLEFYQRCRDFLQDSSCLPGEYTGPRKLVHADLLADHILIAPSLDSITGVIDWSDVTVGDPAGDFAGLWEWQGAEFVQTALRSYGSVIDVGMWDRVRFQGIYAALMHAYYGHQARISSQMEFGLTCLQRIFGSG